MISEKFKLYHVSHTIDHFIHAIYKLNHLIAYTSWCKTIFVMQIQYQEEVFRERIFTLECIYLLILINTLIMSVKSIDQSILSNIKWKNIEYDFSGHLNNCTLNVHIYYLVINNYFMLI